MSLSCHTYQLTISYVFPVFKNVGVRSAAHKYSPVGYPSVVSKTFKKFINNRLFYHLEKCDNFFLSPVWFQVYFFNYRSSDSCN